MNLNFEASRPTGRFATACCEPRPVRMEAGTERVKLED
jgi:hypothetical protein